MGYKVSFGISAVNQPHIFGIISKFAVLDDFRPSCMTPHEVYIGSRGSWSSCKSLGPSPRFQEGGMGRKYANGRVAASGTSLTHFCAQKNICVCKAPGAVSRPLA